MVAKPRKQVQWPLEDAIKVRVGQTGNDELGLLDIEKALVSGNLRSTRRDKKTGKAEGLTAAFWKERRVRIRAAAGMVLFYLPRESGSPRIDVDHVYYVSRSDFERLWSEPKAEEETEMPERRKPGPQATKQWKAHAAREVTRIMIEEGRSPTANEIADYLSKTIGVSPDESDIRKLIRLLL
jgi:hypothetical protein